LLIRHLPASADIRVGDLLVTSGLGGRFPSGYPVARITQVESPAGEAFALVTAEPTSALDRGRFVLVLQGSARDEGES
jgi:rod shape-determining protein MreC